MEEKECILKNDFIISPYRVKRILKKFLITDDYGKWILLEKEDYDKLRFEKIDQNLYDKLYERDLLLNEENKDIIIKRSRNKEYGYLFQAPTLHIVHTTMRCNLKCKYCHANARKVTETEYDCDKETSEKVIEYIMSTPVDSLTLEFQGGEALLTFDIVKIMVEKVQSERKKYKKKVFITLVSNLTTATEDQIDYLIENNVGLCTSLDGPKHIHDKNRGGYDQLVKNIQYIKNKEKDILNKEGNKINLLSAMPLITRHSIGHHKEIIDEYVKLGFDKLWIKTPAAIGFALDNWDEIRISSEEFINFWKNSLEYMKQINSKNSSSKKSIISDPGTTILLKKIFNKNSANYLDLESPCGACIGQVSYDHRGNIYTCDEATLHDIFKVGTINDNFESLFENSTTKSIIEASMNDNNSYCDNCAYKPFCGLCPVVSYRETGKLIPKLPNNRCKSLMTMFDFIFEKYNTDNDYKEMFDSWLEEENKIYNFERMC